MELGKYNESYTHILHRMGKGAYSKGGPKFPGGSIPRDTRYEPTNFDLMSLGTVSNSTWPASVRQNSSSGPTDIKLMLTGMRGRAHSRLALPSANKRFSLSGHANY